MLCLLHHWKNSVAPFSACFLRRTFQAWCQGPKCRWGKLLNCRGSGCGLCGQVVDFWKKIPVNLKGQNLVVKFQSFPHCLIRSWLVSGWHSGVSQCLALSDCSQLTPLSLPGRAGTVAWRNVGENQKKVWWRLLHTASVGRGPPGLSFSYRVHPDRTPHSRWVAGAHTGYRYGLISERWSPGNDIMHTYF